MSTFASSLGWGGRLVKRFTSNKPSAVENLTSFETRLVDNGTIVVDLAALRSNIKFGELLVKDVIKDICRQLGIIPKYAAFFGLYCEHSNGSYTWIVQTRLMATLKSDFKNLNFKKCYFKLQLKVFEWHDLRKRDKKAYEYYLKQCRFEFRTGGYAKYLDSRRSKENDKILLRMIILEMMMVAKEKNIEPLKDLLKQKNKHIFSMEDILKKYIDVEGLRDMSKSKLKVEKSLDQFKKVQQPDQAFITEVELFHSYRDEAFELRKFERNGEKPNLIELWITPKDISKKVILSNVRSCLWQSDYSSLHQLKVCEKDKEDKNPGIKIMILRGDEPPEIMYCISETQCETICSFLDAYYRLLVNQYNSVLHDTAESLTCSPYHGIIDRELVPRILSMKGRVGGNYLIREHSKIYQSYILSLITDEDKFSHLEVLLEERDDGHFVYAIDKNRKFDSLESLLDYYKDGKNKGEIKACLQKIVQPKQSGNVPIYTDPSLLRPALPGRSTTPQWTMDTLGPPLLDPSQIDIVENIKGTFGEVMKSKLDDGKYMIVKRYPTLTADMLSTVGRTLQQLCNHKHVVQFLGLSIVPHGMFLAFEYLPFGSLEKYMSERRDTITYGQLLKFLFQITDAMAFIHNKKLVHADVRFTNILVKDENTIKLGNCCITWKLSGFKMLDERIFRKRFTHLAPEIFLRENAEFSQETDVWSYGLTAWQLFTQEQPFRQCTSQQLMNYFKKVDSKPEDQPPLVALNMNILRYCPEEMLPVFNGSLQLKSQNRENMSDLQRKVQRLVETAPTRDKQNQYFLFDWEERLREIDEFKKNPDTQHRSSTEFHSGESGYHTIGSADSDTTVPRGIFDNKPSSDVVYTMELEERESVVVTEKDENINRETDTDDMIVKQEDNLMEIHSADDASPVAKCKKQVVELSRKQSYSAPSSPTRPKIFRSMSAKEKNQRADQDFEMASILVGLSQAKAPRSSDIAKEVTPRSSTNSRSMIYMPQGHNKASNKPYQSLKSVSRMTARSAISEDEDTPPPSPRPPPPDSPELCRRDFQSDQPRREIARDDKTRTYLQDRINSSRGKRSSSFTEEFDEYKNKAKRAAKRALLGPNPFNIGVKLPENFMLRSDSRIYQPVPALPHDVTRFFKNSSEKVIPTPVSEPSEGSSSHLDPYRNMKDIENYRKNILKTTLDTQSSALDPYRSPEELLSKGIKEMHAHSPSSKSPSSYEDTYISSAAISSTMSAFINSSALSSVRPMESKLCFPYAHHSSHDTYIHPVYSVPPLLTPVSISPTKKNTNTKALSPSIAVSAPPPVSTIFTARPRLYQPDQIRVVRGPTPGLALFDNGYARHPFLHPSHPRIIAFNDSVPLVPPALQRHGHPPPLFLGPSGEHLIPIPPSQTYDRRIPLVPVSVVRSQQSPPDRNIKVKTEPIDDTESKDKQASRRGYQRADIFTLPRKIFESTPLVPPPSTTLFRYISSKDLKTERLLGKGQFGEVYEGNWYFKDKSNVRHTVPVAVKRLKSTDKSSKEPLSKEALLDFKKEADAMSQLHSDDHTTGAKHIIKMYGVCTDDKYVFSIVTEKALMPLDQYIHCRKKELSDGDILLYCKQIANGMEYLHSKNFLHRDLACRNILVMEKRLIKISDFGLSRLLHDKGYYRLSNKKLSFIPIRWLSLEAIGKQIFTVESDYWSYGVTLWEIFTIHDPDYEKSRAFPYENIEPKDIHEHLMNGNRLNKPQDCPDQLWKLVDKCWDESPGLRTTFFIFQQKLSKMMSEIQYTT